MQFAKHVQCRNEKFGAVVFDTLNEKVYVTNETGEDILRLMKEGLDVSEAAERLAERYEADRDRVRSDVAEFFAELRAAGLLASAAEGVA